MGKQYPKSPIMEVLCDLRFQPSPKWDDAVPGLIYEGLKSDYPKRQQAQDIQTEFGAPPGGMKITTRKRLRIMNQDEAAIVQIGENLLSVHLVKSYPGWDGFKPRILRALDAYRLVAEPSSLQRIGLRYINRVEIPSQTVQLRDYFTVLPQLGDELPKEFAGFNLALSFPYKDGRDSLRLQLSNVQKPKQDGKTEFILDLDYCAASKASSVGFDEIPEWLDNAHTTLEEIFEHSISEGLRRTFEG